MTKDFWLNAVDYDEDYVGKLVIQMSDDTLWKSSLILGGLLLRRNYHSYTKKVRDKLFDYAVMIDTVMFARGLITC